MRCSCPSPHGRNLSSGAHAGFGRSQTEDRHEASDEQWDDGYRRARLDAAVASAYELRIQQYAAMLSRVPAAGSVTGRCFPGEPKSFVTRDLALLAFAQELGEEPPDIVELLESAGIELPPPRHDLRRLDVRVDRYREIGAIPYRPTPRGGRPPTDPALIEVVTEALSDEPQTAAALAEVLEEDETLIKKVLRIARQGGECLAQGRGRTRSYYVIEE